MPLVRRPLATYLVSSKFFLVPVALERILFVFVLVICCHDTHTHLHMQRVQSVVTLFLAGNVCSEVCSHRVHQLSPFMVVFFFFLLIFLKQMFWSMLVLLPKYEVTH